MGALRPLRPLTHGRDRTPVQVPYLEELPWKRRDVERWVADLLAQLTEVLTELFTLKRAQAERDAAVDSMRARCVTFVTLPLLLRSLAAGTDEVVGGAGGGYTHSTERAETEALISVNAKAVAELAHGGEVNDALSQLAAARQQLADLRDSTKVPEPPPPATPPSTTHPSHNLTSQRAWGL
jgi:hypothetical protein